MDSESEGDPLSSETLSRTPFIFVVRNSSSISAMAPTWKLSPAKKKIKTNTMQRLKMKSFQHYLNITAMPIYYKTLAGSYFFLIACYVSWRWNVSYCKQHTHLLGNRILFRHAHNTGPRRGWRCYCLLDRTIDHLGSNYECTLWNLPRPAANKQKRVKTILSICNFTFTNRVVKQVMTTIWQTTNKYLTIQLQTVRNLNSQRTGFIDQQH